MITAYRNPRQTTFALLLLATLGHASARAGTWHASPPPCSTDPDTCGGSDASACCRIQHAIDRASDGDTILVRPGTYTGDGNKDLGWAKSYLTVKCEGGPTACKIDCQGSGRGFAFGGTNLGPNAHIEGFTIQNGHSTGYAGAILCYDYSGPTTIENCIITQNEADGEGGGIDCTPASRCTIKGCVITNNKAHTWGGGVIAEGLTVIEGSIIAGNSVEGCCGCDQIDRVAGGVGVQRNALGISEGPKIINSVIAGNYAPCFAGGVLDFAADAGLPGTTIRNSVIIGNEAGQYGGGLVVHQPKSGAAVYNSILWFNESPGTLGKQIYLDDGGTLSVSFSNVQGGRDAVAPDGQVGLGWDPTYHNIGWLEVEHNPSFVSHGGADGDPLTYDAGTDYRIQGGSPVIDAGDNGVIDAYEMDLAGLSRFIQDPNVADSGSTSEAHSCAIVDMGAYEYRASPPDCNCNGVDDFQDINIYHTSSDCNLNGIPDECANGDGPIAVTLAVPADERSLWRSQKNVVRLTFACAIDAPGAGQVLIQELLSGGAFGPDLSSAFTFCVEGGNVLKLQENASTLQHRTWYSIRQTGAWSGMANFALEYLVQRGDATDDREVFNADVSYINSGVPCLSGCDERKDINGDSRILNADVLDANTYVPSLDNVPKPTGH